VSLDFTDFTCLPFYAHERVAVTSAAGHAVVAWTFAVPVVAIRVVFTEEKGWHGGTDYVVGSADHLPLVEQVAVLEAGYAAERVFDCPAHEQAAAEDRRMVLSLLNELSEEQGKAFRDDGYNRARAILENHSGNVRMLVDRLVECGHVDRSEFLSLMYAKAAI
jgi:hypothetical protein